MTRITSAEYKNQLLGAIETVVDHAIANANFDKTIKATIVKCIDQSLGTYTVRYQDVTFNAQSANTNVLYNNGTSVYVLIPGNDMSQEKTIIGAVDINAVDYNTVIEGENRYDKISDNLVHMTNKNFEWALCSFNGPDTPYDDYTVLYNANNPAENHIGLDPAVLNSTIKSGNGLIVAAKFKTNIEQKQRKFGNYGLAFEMEFVNPKSSSIPIIQTYYLDINNFVGSPYSLVDFTRQNTAFDLKIENFIRLRRVIFFAKDFKLKSSEHEDDIFVKDLEIYTAYKLTDEELADYYLALYTEGANYFDGAADEEPINIKTRLRVKGKEVSEKTGTIEYFWFRLNPDITSAKPEYVKYGGEGWECINDFIYEDEINDIRIYKGGNNYLQVTEEMVADQAETVYKCVIVDNDEAKVEKQITITNYAANYRFYLTSTLGFNSYSWDGHYPDLTCVMEKRNENTGEYEIVTNLNGYKFQWSTFDNTDRYLPLDETESLNNIYNNQYIPALNELNDLYSGGYISQEEYINRLNSLNNTYKDVIDAQRVEKNYIYNVQPIDTANQYQYYKCSIYREVIGGNDIFIGAVEDKIDNKPIEGDYYLELVNGTQVFEYNNKGISPSSKSNSNPLTIQPITFRIYNKATGLPISDEVLNSCQKTWLYPNAEDKNSMLTDITLSNQNRVLTYNIEDRYNKNLTNNTIYLTVDFKGLVLQAETHLSFVKNGDPGTNGTDTVCLIVPNIKTGTTYTFGDSPILNMYSDPPSFNFTPAQNGKYFKIQLWEGGKLKYEGTESNANYIVHWSILKFKNNEVSCFSINDNDNSKGIITPISNYNANTAYSNIIQCKVTTGGKTYYGAYPVITSYVNWSSIRVHLKQNTGFSYATYLNDGTRPDYDNNYPFTIQTWRKVGEYWKDISTDSSDETGVSEYIWTVRGYDYIGGSSTGLIENTNQGAVEINQKWYKPVDKIDGSCTYNSLKIQVRSKVSGNIMGHINIPVYTYLNKYGIDSLNDWDGTSISLDNNNNAILAPQVGAGTKDNQNRFTGVLMGKVTNGTSIEEGLFEYHNGERTIFLNAKTGKAEFGKAGSGQIIIDPSQSDKALIYGGNYVAGTSGMLIDLSSPTIKYGSGNFEVNSSGHITAKGGGSIAGWSISDTKLSKGKVGISSDNSADTNYAFWAGNATAASAPFSVTFGGALTATSATIKGNITAESGKIGNWVIGNNSLYNGGTFNDSTQTPTLYLGTADLITNNTVAGHTAKDWRLKINNNFGVDSSGNMYANGVDLTGKITANSGKIGNWDIGSTTISQEHGDYTVTIANYNNDNAGSRILHCTYKKGTADEIDTFKVTRNGYVYANNAEIEGKITATSGKIAGWQIYYEKNNQGEVIGSALRTGSGNGIYLGTTGITATIAGASRDNIVFKSSSKFGVDSSGKLYASGAYINGEIEATSGSIAGFTINEGYLTAGSGNNQVGISSRNGTDYAFWAGGSSTAAPFRVGHGGEVICTNFNASNSGYIGNWQIKSDGLYGTNTTMYSSGKIVWKKDPGYFVMGAAGGTGEGTDHPFVSAINIGYNPNANGVVFRNGTSWDNPGAAIGQVKIGDTLIVLSGKLGGRNVALNGGSGNNYFIFSENQMTTTSSVNILANGQSGSASGNGILIRSGNSGHITLDASAGGYVYAHGSSGGEGRVAIDSSGPSSKCLKTDIIDYNQNEYNEALDLLKEIKIYNYKYKYNIHPKENQYGFIIDDLLDNKKANKFLYFKDEKAKVLDDNYLSYLVETDEEEVNAIHFKRYDEETLIKYLLVCCKALQQKIEKLEKKEGK